MICFSLAKRFSGTAAVCARASSQAHSVASNPSTLAKSLRFIPRLRIPPQMFRLTSLFVPAGFQLSAFAYEVHHEQHQKVPRLNEITAHQPARLTRQPKSPLEPKSSRPTWWRWHKTGTVVDSSAIGRQNHTRIEPFEIFLRPN